MFWSIFVQPEMTAAIVIIREIGPKSCPKRCLVGHNDMIKTLSSDGSDEALDIRNPFRCQAMTVSGLTIATVDLHCGQNRRSPIQRNRSQDRSFGRRAERFKTMIWCRRARILIWSAKRDRKPAMRADNRKITMLCIKQKRSCKPWPIRLPSSTGKPDIGSGAFPTLFLN
jgi:hypothetical protein